MSYDGTETFGSATTASFAHTHTHRSPRQSGDKYVCIYRYSYCIIYSYTETPEESSNNILLGNDMYRTNVDISSLGWKK
jgi:hypothetical protein